LAGVLALAAAGAFAGAALAGLGFGASVFGSGAFGSGAATGFVPIGVGVGAGAALFCWMRNVLPLAMSRSLSGFPSGSCSTTLSTPMPASAPANVFAFLIPSSEREDTGRGARQHKRRQ